MLQDFEEYLNWEVIEAPIYDQFGEAVKGHKLLTNSATGGVLQVCKSSYTPTTNRQLLQVVDTITQTQGLQLTGFGTFKGGKKVMAYLKNENPHSPAGLKLNEHLVVGNSHDGSTAFFMGMTTNIYRCSNMFTQRNMQAKVYHRSDQAEQVKRATETIDLYYDQQRDLYTSWEDWSDRQLKPKDKDLIANTILEIGEGQEVSTRKKNSLDKLHEALDRETSDLGNNVFAAFNGVTYYTSHLIKQQNALYGNPFGHSANLNAKAFELCSELAKERQHRTVISLPTAANNLF